MKHMMLSMLVMLAAQVGASQMRADIQHGSYGHGTMKVYDGDKLLFQTISQGLNGVITSKFSPDGRWLVNLTEQGYIQLWSIPERKQVKTFFAPMPRVLSADFTPDSHFLLLNFWGEKEPPKGQAVNASSFWKLSPLQHVAQLSDGRICGQKYKYLCSESGYDRSVTYSKDGQYMVFVRFTSSASIWDAKTGAYINTIPRLPYPEKDRGGAGSQYARLSPDGKRVLVLYADGRLAEYEAKTAKLLKVRGKPTDYQKQLDRFAQTGH